MAELVDVQKQIYKIYGPYFSKDGRRRVVFYYTDKSCSTMSYARYLYMKEKGEISKDLTIDHIDENRSNDIIENLQPLTRSENIKKAWQEGKNKAKEWFKGICHECGKEFEKPMNHVKHNRKQNKVGPFCGRICAGRHNQRIQMEIKRSALVAQLVAGN